jgi:hypothetical protein
VKSTGQNLHERFPLPQVGADVRGGDSGHLRSANTPTMNPPSNGVVFVWLSPGYISAYPMAIPYTVNPALRPICARASTIGHTESSVEESLNRDP